jgi:POT family proton-dependent oligopeptide transporter
MAKKKIEPNTVIKFGMGSCFAAAFYVFYYTRFFADEGLTSLNVFTYGVVITFELSLTDTIMTKLSQKKIIWDDDGNVVLASAYGQYAAGLLGAGMSSPDEELLSYKTTGYTEGYYQLHML